MLKGKAYPRQTLTIVMVKFEWKQDLTPNSYCKKWNNQSESTRMILWSCNCLWKKAKEVLYPYPKEIRDLESILNQEEGTAQNKISVHKLYYYILQWNIKLCYSNSSIGVELSQTLVFRRNYLIPISDYRGFNPSARGNVKRTSKVEKILEKRTLPERWHNEWDTKRVVANQTKNFYRRLGQEEFLGRPRVFLWFQQPSEQ